MNIASLFQAVASLSWLVLLGLVALAVYRATRAKPIKNAVAMIVTFAVFALLLSIVSAGLVFVEPNQRGVVSSPYSFRAPLGYLSEPLTPGLRWIVPGEVATLYSISRQTYTMSVAANEGDVYGDDSILARTKDGQEVSIDASVIYSIDPDQVVSLHITWQERYQDEVIRPLARGIIRDIASQFGVEEIISTKRTELEDGITSDMTAKLKENDLILVDFILRDIHFSEEYAAAIEQKQIAEQQAIQAQFVVEQRHQEAEQARQVAQGAADAVVIQAQGDADARLIQAEAETRALEMIAAALKDRPDLIQYIYVTKLAPNIQVMLLPSNAPYILPIQSLMNSNTTMLP